MNNKTFSKYKTGVYTVSSIILIVSCLNFIVGAARNNLSAASAEFVLIHILFLLSLGAVSGSIIIEYSTAFLADYGKSRIKEFLYDGKEFLPLRTFIFIGVFTALYIFLACTLNLNGTIGELILLIPPFAIFFNARRILSRRVRFINGHYIYYDGKLNTVISYYTDVEGKLIFVTNDGKLKNTGATAADTDFKALGEELSRNGLKSGAKL